MTSQRVLQILIASTALTLSFAGVCDAQAVNDLGGTLFSQKATPTGSKIIVKRKIKNTDADRENSFHLDPCGGDADDIWTMEIEIDNGSTVEVLTISHPSTDFVTNGCPAYDGNNTSPLVTDRALLDDGVCKVKVKLQHDNLNSGVAVAGTFVAKCISTIPVTQVENVRVTVTASCPTCVTVYTEMCFFTPASGCVAPATVKADGSDGRKLKLLAAPAVACSSC